ncbi:MAG: hypothetical protein ACE5I5_15330 [Candidatus Heimdallarchaeota archaeon]
MKIKQKSFLIIIILLGIFGTAYTKAQETVPTNIVPKLLKLPLIDGQITEEEYGRVFSPLHPFSSPLTLQDDDVFLAHDGVSLYIAWDAKASIENASIFYVSTQIVPSRVKDVCMPEESDIKIIRVNGNSITFEDGKGAKSQSGQISFVKDIQEDGKIKVGRSTGNVVIEMKMPLVSDPQDEDITMVSGVSYGIAFAFITGTDRGYHGTGGGVTAEFQIFRIESRADFPAYEIVLLLGVSILCIGTFIVLMRREWKIIPK